MIPFIIILTVPILMGRADSTHGPSRHIKPPPPHLEKQSQPLNDGFNQHQQSIKFEQYLYHPSMPPSPMPLHQQHWNQYSNHKNPSPNTNPLSQNQQPKNPNFSKTPTPQQRNGQRQRVLVDYPFTVEYVDRRDPSKMSKYDRNLVDVPFTVEYVNEMNENANHHNRGGEGGYSYANRNNNKNRESDFSKFRQQGFQNEHNWHFAGHFISK